MRYKMEDKQSVGAVAPSNRGFTGAGPHPGDPDYVPPPPPPIYTSEDFVSFELEESQYTEGYFKFFGIKDTGGVRGIYLDSCSKPEVIEDAKAFANGKPIVLKEYPQVLHTAQIQ